MPSLSSHGSEVDLAATRFQRSAEHIAKTLAVSNPELADQVMELQNSFARLSKAVTRLVVQKPLNLILVRHGQSEGNYAKILKKQGNLSPEKEEELNSIPENHWRLTPKGQSQAQAAGAWLKENLNLKIDAAYVSDFVRARETAGNLGLTLQQDLDWRSNPFCGERSWADFENLSQATRDKQRDLRIKNPRHWRPPVIGGQSLRELEGQVRLGLDSIFRNHSGQNVIIAGHGEQIIAAMSIIQKLPEAELSQLLRQGIPNGGIVIFSRQNPRNGKVAKSFKWVKFVDPMNRERHSETWNSEWQKFSRPTFSNKSLIEEAQAYPRVL